MRSVALGGHSVSAYQKTSGGALPTRTAKQTGRDARSRALRVAILLKLFYYVFSTTRFSSTDVPGSVAVLSHTTSVVSGPRGWLRIGEEPSSADRAGFIGSLAPAMLETFADECVHEIFARVARDTPTTLAIEVLGGGRTCSYGELLEQANAVAVMVSDAGGQRDILAAVMISRSCELLISILGVLSAGSAFVPMDPSYPAQRLQWMLEDASAAVLLHVGQPKPAAAALCGTAIDMASLTSLSAPVSLDADEHRRARPDDLMYAIFTSGSTGRPKGVLIEHRSAANLGCEFVQRWSVSPSDRVFQFFSPSFDPSILDYMLALLSGARLLLRPTQNEWREALMTSGATIAGLTPSALTQLRPSELPSSCRLLMVGGEALPQPVARTWAAEPRATLNVYGPTEATIWATSQLLTSSDLDKTEVCIGVPLRGLTCTIVEPSALAPIDAVGVIGELCVGGVGVARGYLHRPEQTAASFVPSADGTRMYRTGDLARRLADGRLVCLGRADSQVKLRGHRIELGEVEAAAVLCPGVANAAAVISEESGVQRMALYVAPARRIDVDALRAALCAVLPKYALPNAIWPLEVLPMSPAGKLDRRALSRRPDPCVSPAELLKLVTRLERTLRLPIALCERADGTLQCELPRMGAHVAGREGRRSSQDVIAAWTSVWADTYAAGDDKAAGYVQADGPFECSHESLQAWVAAACGRIRSLAAGTTSTILELGCGTGMLAAELSRDFSYAGIDPVPSVIASLRDELPHATFELGSADTAPAHLINGALVVINSVAQYFPNARYLQSVLTRCHRLGAAAVFVGDVRAAELLPYQRRDLHAAADRVENELCPPLCIFHGCGFTNVRVLLHADGTKSHLERYRCDVHLEIEHGDALHRVEPSLKARAWKGHADAITDADLPGWVQGVPNAALRNGDGLWLSELVVFASARGMHLEARPSVSADAMDLFAWPVATAPRMPFVPAFHHSAMACVREALIRSLPGADSKRVRFDDVDSHSTDEDDDGGSSSDSGSDRYRGSDWAHEVLQAVHDLTGPAGIGLDTPLMNAGIDSLTAVVLAGKINQLVGQHHGDRRFGHTLVFEAPTARAIAAHLVRENSEVAPQLSKALSLSVPSVAALCSSCGRVGGGIDNVHASLAISAEASGDGVSAHWPSSREAGMPSGSDLTPPPSVRAGSFVAGAQRFDADAFAVTHAEGRAMEPRQRLLLEVGYTALHASGWQRAALHESSVGVFAAILAAETQLAATSDEGTSVPLALLGSTMAVAAGRISFVLGLLGPSVALDTACSAALVTLQLAAHALEDVERSLISEAPRGFERKSSLSTSASIRVDARFSTLLAASGFLSPRCRSFVFDAAADGYVRGEAVCAVVLQPQAYGLRATSVTRQDGKSASLTAPNGDAQRRLLTAVMAKVGSESLPAELEAHGSGTKLGDPTEVRALVAARTQAPSKAGDHHMACVSGSKANIGHSEVSAGHVGLLRASQLLSTAVRHGNAHLRVLNALVREGAISGQLGFGTQGARLPHSATCASGVSSFGFAGTIAHTMLSNERASHETAAVEQQPSKVGWRRGRFPVSGALCCDPLKTMIPSQPLPSATLLSSVEVRATLCEHISQLIVGGNNDPNDVKVHSAVSLDDLGLDSLAVLTLRDGIEHALGIQLDTRVILGATLDSLCEHAVNRLAQAASASLPAEGGDAMRLMGDAADGGGFTAFAADAFMPRPSLWFPLPTRATRPLIMVLTSLRSGSSLFSFILNAHPDLFAPQGLFLLPYANLKERREHLEGNILFLADGLLHAISHLWGCGYSAAKAIAAEWEDMQLPMQAVYDLLQQRCHPRILVDRGTENARSLDVLRRAPAMFDDLRIVHLMRHPYSVLHSGSSLLRRTCLARRVIRSDDVADGSAFEAALFDYVDATWGQTHSNVLAWLDECAGSLPYGRVRFEELTTSPAESLATVCEAIGISYDAAMLRPYDDDDNVRLHNAAGEAGVSSRDPKLMSHGNQISSANAAAWKTHMPCRPLSALSSSIARVLGYTLAASPQKAAALADGGLVELLNAPADGAEGAIFLAPGSDGELLGFAPLAKALDGRRRIYGLRVTEEVPRDTVSHAAAAYVAPIAALVGVGGCVVGGMSSGGCVAYELAAQLSRHGIRVTQLICIDRNPFEMSAPLFAPGRTNDPGDGNVDGSVAASVDSLHGRNRGVGHLSERLADLDRQLEAKGEVLSVEALLTVLGPTDPVQDEQAHLKRYAKRFVASHHLIRAYTPSVSLVELCQMGVRGVALFRADETPRTRLRDGMHEIEIGGCHHYSILSHPAFVRAFVEVVEQGGKAC